MSSIIILKVLINMSVSLFLGHKSLKILELPFYFPSMLLNILHFRQSSTGLKKQTKTKQKVDVNP